jgi:hypothetical protein
MTVPLTASRLLPALVVAAGLFGCAQEPYPATGVRWAEDFRSDLVGDDYVLRIRIPPEETQPGPEGYPLVVQLDPTYVGLEQYATTVGLVSEHAGHGEWPEAIVVGVDYEDPWLRERDYALPDPPRAAFDGDGADLFYRMLEEELLPHLEATLDIDTSRRFLLGHSKGGVFAWYAALRHDPSMGPPLFAGVVAADAGYGAELFTYERWHAERSDDLPASIYATRAIYNGAVQQVGFDAMSDRVLDYPSLVLETEVLDTDHAGAVWPSYEHGLDFLIGGAR